MYRNYLLEAHMLGKSYHRIASEIGVSGKTAKQWATGITKPKVDYEALRNVYRRASYQYLRAEHVPAQKARGKRRTVPVEVVEYREEFSSWFAKTSREIWEDWNKNHLDPSNPKHISYEEVQRRLQKGLDSGKTEAEIENY